MNNTNDLGKKVLEPFREIFAIMGISDNQVELAAENFSLPPLTDAERNDLLKGKPVDPKILRELMNNLAPLVPFAYKEHIVLVYIRDQYLTQENYEHGNYNRFHLCFCQHLRASQKKNRYEARYVMTYNTNGKFLVNLFSLNGEPLEQNVYRQLKVCQHCLRELNWKNFRQYCGAGRAVWLSGNKAMRQRIVDEFDINEYLLTAQKNKSNFPPVEFTDLSAIKKEYVLPPSWKAALKKNADYTCELCRRKFGSEHLEIHHKNHNQGDNRRDNLMVLCCGCHAKIHAVEGGVCINKQKSHYFEYADTLKTLGDIYSALCDETAAKNFYRKASGAYVKISSDLDAQFELANLYLREPKTKSIAKQLFERYLSSAKSGTVKERIRIALIYAKGLGVPKNLPKAQKFFNIVQDSRNIFLDSEFIELVRLMEGIDVAERLHAQAIEIFESAAQSGDIFAVGELVKLYSNKHFIAYFGADESLKSFFDNAQRLFSNHWKEINPF